MKFRGLLSLALVVTLLAMAAAVALADEHSVDFDPKMDFSQFKTFTIRRGANTAKAPELNSPITMSKIENAIRSELTARGLEESARPDLVVNFRLGAVKKQEVQTWTYGRWGRGVGRSVNRFTEGTMVIDMMNRGARELVWRGIYRDDEKDPTKVSHKLPDDVKKLFDKFPVKKR